MGRLEPMLQAAQHVIPNLFRNDTVVKPPPAGGGGMMVILDFEN